MSSWQFYAVNAFRARVAKSNAVQLQIILDPNTLFKSLESQRKDLKKIVLTFDPSPDYSSPPIPTPTTEFKQGGVNGLTQIGIEQTTCQSSWQ